MQIPLIGGKNQTPSKPTAIEAGTVPMISAPLTSPLAGGVSSSQGPRKPKTAAGSLISTFIAGNKTSFEYLTKDFPSFLGHLTAGDWKSARASVESPIQKFRRKYEDTEGVLEEGAKFFKGSQSVSAGILRGTQELSKAVGQLSAGDYDASLKTLNDIPLKMGKEVDKGTVPGDIVRDTINEFWPEYGEGCMYFVVKDKQGQTSVSKVQLSKAAQFVRDTREAGMKIVSSETVKPVQNFTLDRATGTWNMNLADTAAAVTDLVDPVTMAAAEGGGRLILKEGTFLLKNKLAVRAAEEIGSVASKVANNKTVSGVLDALERNPAIGASIRPATKRLGDTLRPAMTSVRALKAKLDEQTAVITSALRGDNKNLVKIAETYSRAWDNEDAVYALMEQLKAAGLEGESIVDDIIAAKGKIGDDVRATLTGAGVDASAAAKSVHEYVNGAFNRDRLKWAETQLITHGIDPQYADTIIDIAKMSKDDRAMVDKLAKAWASGETILDDVAARIPGEATPLQLGNAVQYGQGTVIDPKLVDAARRAHTVLADVSAQAAKFGLEADQIKALADVYRLPQLGIQTGLTDEVMTDFASLLKNRSVPKRLAITPTEMEAFHSAAPGMAALDAQTKRVLIAGKKLIDEAEVAGASQQVITRMRKALIAGAGKREEKGLFDYVYRVYQAENKVAKYEAAEGAAAATTKRRIAATKVRSAVEKEAAAAGLDPEVVVNAARIAREADDQWGRLMVDVGMIDKRTYMANKGLHIHRSYGMWDNVNARWSEIEDRIAQIGKSNPMQAAALEQELTEFRMRVSALENTGSRFGPIGTSLGKARQDLSMEFRQLLDEHEKLSDAMTVGGKKVAKDISAATLMKSIKDLGLYSDEMAPGFTEYILNEPKTWGALAGKWVTPLMKSRLTIFKNTYRLHPDQAMSMWTDYVIRPWKMAAVVYNPVARLHNSVSNVIAAQLAIGTTDATKLGQAYYAALKSMVNRDEIWQQAAELSPSVRQASFLMETNMGADTGGVFERLFMQNKAANSMQWEESVGKLAVIHGALEKGMTMEQAVMLSEKWLVDYGDVPPIINVLRSKLGVLPFMTYTYKMAGNLLKTPVTNPQWFGSAWKLYTGLNEFVPKDVRESEQGVLPDWMKDKLTVRLPGSEPRYLVLDSYIPWNIFDVEAKGSTPRGIAFAMGQLGWPYKQFFELAFNKNSLTGADIVPEEADATTKAIMRGKYLFNTIPQARTMAQLEASVFGRPYSPRAKAQKWYDVLAQIKNIDLDREGELSYNRAVDDYQKTVRLAIKTQASPSMSDVDKQKSVRRLLQEADNKMAAVRQASDAMVRFRNLKNLLAEAGAGPDSTALIEKLLIDQVEPLPAAKKRIVDLGRGMFSGPVDIRELERRVTQMRLSVNSTRTTPQPVAAPPKMPQPNMEMIDEAAENLQKLAGQNPGGPFETQTGNPTPSVPLISME